MNTFAQRVAEWQAFYSTVGGACDTLTGLLFVSLSLNVDILNRAESAEWMHIARQTFGDFLYVLMIALLFLAPQHAPVGMAVGLLALGGARGWGLLQQFRRARRGPPGSQAARHMLRQVGPSLVVTLGLVAVAIAVVLGYYDALFGLVGVLAAVLVSASRNAWFLLVQVRPSKR
jgi:hypothetical protein